jgi:asparagine synthase (glutamine-hydrolysing)
MSGICGYLNAPATPGTETLERMVVSLNDNSRNKAVSATASRAGVASTQEGTSAHQGRCLAVIEGQPRWSDPGLAKLAETAGHAVAVASAFERFDQDFLRYLHGAFSVAVLEPEKQYALLAVDRLGTRPLAFNASQTNLVFASRLDALLVHPDINRNIDLQALFDYLYFHMIPSPGTIYRDSQKVLPAQVVVYRRGQVSKHFYWHVPYTEDPGLSEPELQTELLALLRESVAGSIPPESVGAFLSGGLDSSTVTGLLAESGNGPADAFGIGFSAEGYDEMAYARITAKRFNVKLHEYYVTPDDVTTSLPVIAEAYDEPFGNASALPAYDCARFAKDSGKRVLLAGDGGDEIFAGNARYAKQKVFELYRQVPRLLRTGVLEPLLLGPGVMAKLPILRKARSYIQQANIPMPDRMESYNFLHRSPLDTIFSSDLLATINVDAPVENIRDAYHRADVDSLLKRMLHIDLKITLADNDLRKVNRMCELADIGVRYPMLDERLVEFAARVPSSMLLKRFELRSFYRDALGKFLAPETLDKNKQGFGLPFGVWMVEHQPLKTLAYDSLDSFKKRGYLKPAYLDQLIEQHRTGHASYYGVMIWVLTMLEQWLHTHGH